MRRREFLISALAAAPAATALAAGPAAAVVFEASAPPARAFASAAVRRGADAYAIEGDVTDLWFHQLQPRWARAPSPLAGLTFYPALFCLERLAWDHGLRLAAFAAHVALHRLDASALVADLLDPRGRRPLAPSSAPPNSTDLVSWLIAPKN